MLLDSMNNYGCYDFSDTKCDHFFFGIQDIELNYGTLYITAAASHVEFGRYYNEVKQESDRPFIEAWEGGCKAQHLSIEVYAGTSEYALSKKIKFPHTDEVVEFPLTRDKFKRIMYLEYSSPSPRYKEVFIDDYDYKGSLNQCHFSIKSD